MVTVYIGLSFIPLVLLSIYLSKNVTTVDTCYDSDFARNLRNYNFQLIGEYNSFVYHSLRLWCYSLEVSFYRINIQEDLHQLLLDWNAVCNVDPNGTLNDAIEWSHTAFLEELDIARELKREPHFGVSVDFDYTQFGNSLKNNDYVDMNTIIGYIDDIMEVHNGQ